MPEDANPTPEPPLVVRVAVPVAGPPRPGLLEALFWCLVFLAAQIGGALVIAAGVLSIYAVQSSDAGQFYDDQLAGFGRSTSRASSVSGQPRPPLPIEVGQALAYGMLSAQLTSLVVIALILPRRIGRDWKRQLGFRRPSALHTFLIVVLVPGFLILSGALQELTARLTGLRPPAALEALNGVFRTVPWYVTFLSVALGPGFVEEVWCRGYLGRGLCARYGLTAGVALTSVLFAVMHLDPSQVIVITVMGAFLHFVYLASRSIWVPILLHTLNNGIAILVALTQGPAVLSVESPAVPPILYLVAASLVLFASIALWTGRAVLVPADEWKPEYPGVSTPPTGSGVRIVHEAVSPVAVLFTLVSFGVLAYLLSQ